MSTAQKVKNVTNNFIFDSNNSFLKVQLHQYSLTFPATPGHWSPIENQMLTDCIFSSSGTAAVIGDTALSRPDHHYWEIKFTSPVYGSDVMVGLATKKLDLATHVHSFTSFLGNDDSSLGYSYHGYVRKDGVKKRYGDKWSKGDIIGVHLDTWKGTVSFYKNRQLQGQAWAGLGGEDWFPVVSSTAAKSSMILVNTISFKNTLQLLCFMTLSEKYPKSDLLNIYLPPALRYVSDILLSSAGASRTIDVRLLVNFFGKNNLFLSSHEFSFLFS